jgi:hypothetical protein
MRNKHYKIFSQRLDDKNIKWLFKEKEKFGSWNLLFNDLIKVYGQKSPPNQTSLSSNQT